MIAAIGTSVPVLARLVIPVVLAAVIVAPPAAAAPPAGAPGGQVRLLQPSSSDPRTRRCWTRLREELVAGGFEVAIAEFGAGGDGRWVVDPPSPPDRSIATIALVGNPDQGAAELWIVNGVPWGRAVVRRLLVPAGAGTRDDEVLAIRALEFLRASALELTRTRPAAPVPSPTPSAPPATSVASNTPPMKSASAPASTGATAATVAVAPPPEAGPERRPRALAVELGVSVLDSSPALGPAFLPVARLRAEWLSLIETRLTMAAFGTRTRLTTARGTALVGHALALAELRAVFRHGRVVRPAIGLGAGMLRVDVEGEAALPYEAVGGHRWTALFDVGAGVTVRLGGRMSVAFELHGQLAAPAPTVHFSGEEAARVGRPALFSSVTLVAAL